MIARISRQSRFSKNSKGSPIGIIAALVACACLLFSLSASAASSKRIERSIDVDELSHIDFDVSVAEMDIEFYDGDTVQLDVELRAQRSWWIFGRRSIDDVEMEIRRDGESLDIRLDMDNIEQDWRVLIPQRMAFSMELGVGDVDVEGVANDFLLEMGVGSIEVTVEDIDFESVQVTTGVGDSSLRGFGRNTDNERNIVGADSHYYGDGEYRIDIEVAVGDARVIRR